MSREQNSHHQTAISSQNKNQFLQVQNFYLNPNLDATSEGGRHGNLELVYNNTVWDNEYHGNEKEYI